jgi:hypothetical protein
MNHRQRHWLEKVQVQLASLLGLAAFYLLVWPLVRLADPQAALAFLPGGSAGSVLIVAAAAAVVAVPASVATLGSRPAGGLLAAFVAVGGLSLRSEPMRNLLWVHQDQPSRLFVLLMIESILLVMVLLASALVVRQVRRSARKIRPGLVWLDPLGEAGYGLAAGGLEGEAFRVAAGALTGRGGADRGKTDARGQLAVRYLLCSAMALAVSVVLVLLLMRSGLRGQVLFALLASFALGVLAAHQKFPVPFGVLFMVLPMVAAVGFYAFGVVTAVAGEWTSVPPQVRALPIDWLSAGAGGSVMGYWISARIHEFRHFEQKQGEQHG